MATRDKQLKDDEVEAVLIEDAPPADRARTAELTAT